MAAQKEGGEGGGGTASHSSLRDHGNNDGSFRLAGGGELILVALAQRRGETCAEKTHHAPRVDHTAITNPFTCS